MDEMACCPDHVSERIVLMISKELSPLLKDTRNGTYGIRSTNATVTKWSYESDETDLGSPIIPKDQQLAATPHMSCLA